MADLAEFMKQGKMIERGHAGEDLKEKKGRIKRTEYRITNYLSG